MYQPPRVLLVCLGKICFQKLPLGRENHFCKYKYTTCVWESEHIAPEHVDFLKTLELVSFFNTFKEVVTMLASASMLDSLRPVLKHHLLDILYILGHMCMALRMTTVYCSSIKHVFWSKSWDVVLCIRLKHWAPNQSPVGTKSQMLKLLLQPILTLYTSIKYPLGSRTGWCNQGCTSRRSDRKQMFRMLWVLRLGSQ